MMEPHPIPCHTAELHIHQQEIFASVVHIHPCHSQKLPYIIEQPRGGTETVQHGTDNHHRYEGGDVGTV